MRPTNAAPAAERSDGHRLGIASGNRARPALYGEDAAEVHALRSLRLVLTEPQRRRTPSETRPACSPGPRQRMGGAVLRGFGKLDHVLAQGAGVSTTSREVSAALRNDSERTSDGASDGNRTRATSLGSWSSTIELHSRAPQNGTRQA